MLETIGSGSGSPAMSSSRPTSPNHTGGYSAPGFHTPGFHTPPHHQSGSNVHTVRTVSWADAKARAAKIKGYGAYESNQSFTKRYLGRMSASLPFHNSNRNGYTTGRDYREKEKLGRGRWTPMGGTRKTRFWDVATMIRRMAWRFRLRVAVALLFVIYWILFYATRECARTLPLHPFHTNQADANSPRKRCTNCGGATSAAASGS